MQSETLNRPVDGRIFTETHLKAIAEAAQSMRELGEAVATPVKKPAWSKFTERDKKKRGRDFADRHGR